MNAIYTKFAAFFARFQEWFIWLPVTILLIAGCWTFFAIGLPFLNEIVANSLVELSVRVACALAALAMTRLVWARWRMRLTAEQKEKMFEGIIRGDLGALWIFTLNAVMFFSVLWLMLRTFSLSA